jgi:anti-sigma factor RsiW
MISDETLQRLVDGELDPSEYQEVLLALEADPSTCESNLWRRCARRRSSSAPSRGSRRSKVTSLHPRSLQS